MTEGDSHEVQQQFAPDCNVLMDFVFPANARNQHEECEISKIL